MFAKAMQDWHARRTVERKRVMQSLGLQAVIGRDPRRISLIIEYRVSTRLLTLSYAKHSSRDQAGLSTKLQKATAILAEAPRFQEHALRTSDARELS